MPPARARGSGGPGVLTHCSCLSSRGCPLGLSGAGMRASSHSDNASRRGSFLVPRSRPEWPAPRPALAGRPQRLGYLRTSGRSALRLLRDAVVAGESVRRSGQDFPLGRKPVLIGLAVDAAARGPDLVGALANAVFQALIHVRSTPSKSAGSVHLLKGTPRATMPPWNFGSPVR